MQDELKACPFCGQKPMPGTWVIPNQQDMHFGPNHLNPRNHVFCNCNAQGPQGTSAEAIAAWNTRVDPALAAAQAEVARYREALDMAAFRMQLMVDRMPPDEDGKSSKWLSQTYVNEARAALVQP